MVSISGSAMVTIFVSNAHETRRADTIEPEWLKPKSGYYVWVDLTSPTEDEDHILHEPFGFHELAIEDALGEPSTPKVESVRRVPVHDPARHRLSAARHSLRDPRGRHLRRRAVPGHGARRLSRSVAALARRSARATTRARAKGRRRCCTASSIRWSTTTGRRSTSSRRGSTSSSTTCSIDRRSDDDAFDPRPQARRGLAAPGGDAAARRGRPARPPRVRAWSSDTIAYRFRDVYDQLVRFADEADVLPGPDHRAARRAPVVHVAIA